MKKLNTISRNNEIIALYKSGITVANHIAKQLNITPFVAESVLKKYGLKPTGVGAPRLNRYNNNYFSTIDTNEKAY